MELSEEKQRELLALQQQYQALIVEIETLKLKNKEIEEVLEELNKSNKNEAYEVKDWKELLDEQTKQTLKEILQKTQLYLPALRAAEDARIAQLWLAVALLKKELDEKTKLLEVAVQPWKAIVEIGNAEKRRTIEKIIADIIQPKDKEQKEIVDKLVDSLMKF